MDIARMNVSSNVLTSGEAGSEHEWVDTVENPVLDGFTTYLTN